MQPEPTDYLSLVMKHNEPKCGRTRAHLVFGNCLLNGSKKQSDYSYKLTCLGLIFLNRGSDVKTKARAIQHCTLDLALKFGE